MFHRAQQLRIDSRQPRQRLRIQPISKTRAGRERDCVFRYCRGSLHIAYFDPIPHRLLSLIPLGMRRPASTAPKELSKIGALDGQYFAHALINTYRWAPMCKLALCLKIHVGGTSSLDPRNSGANPAERHECGKRRVSCGTVPKKQPNRAHTMMGRKLFLVQPVRPSLVYSSFYR